ncbi:MAG: ATP-binding cassette domain-containing protein [candidate division WOR-3 bacterium]
MIRVEQVSKSFSGRLVLDRVSFEVPDRRVVVILGPSGIGKTVLLRVMTGLLAPDSGRVSYDGLVVRYGAFSDNRAVLRQLGFVFQGGALFDSIDVAGNVGLPLSELDRLGSEERRARVQAVLERVGMLECAQRWPRELSGGMIRLVAIARALVRDPRYLFLDEPTSGLDPVMKERICRLIAGLRDEEGKTEVVVSHDLEAVKAVADEIFMLREARLVPLERVRKEDYRVGCSQWLVGNRP